MPLVMVLTELIQNAFEHGFDGSQADAEIDIVAQRDLRTLRIAVRDNGFGLPDDFDLATSEHLGLQIVQTLVSIELGGELVVGPNPAGRGTEVAIVIPLRV